MKKNKDVKFNTFDEFMSYYSRKKEKDDLGKNKYYKMGIEIARLASQKACKVISFNQM